MAELDGLDLRILKRQDITPADVQVSASFDISALCYLLNWGFQITVNGADLRLHLCADTGGVLGAFIGSFSSIFATPSDTPYALSPRSIPVHTNIGKELKVQQRNVSLQRLLRRQPSGIY